MNSSASNASSSSGRRIWFVIVTILVGLVIAFIALIGWIALIAMSNSNGAFMRNGY